MSEHKLSMRQLLTLLFAALLSPVVTALPGYPARLAGRAGWLSAVAALPVLLGLIWALCALGRDGGLSAGFQRALGRRCGKGLTLVYLLWGDLLLCAAVRRFGLRFLASSYRNGPLVLYMAVLLALGLWLVRKGLPAVARAGQIFYLALALALGFSLLLGMVQIRPGNVLPVWTEDLPGVGRAALPVLETLGYVVFGAFLGNGIESGGAGRRQALIWGTVFCGVLTLMQWVCLGCLGAGLTAELDAPFFIMVRDIGVEGAMERVESLLIALWVFSDLALTALLLTACCTMAGEVFPLKDGKTACWPLTLLAFAGAIWLFPDAPTLENWTQKVLFPGNLLLGFAVPALVWLVDVLRTQKKK